jgi:stage IV sporulation protein A
MTSEPKFIPEEAAEISPDGKTKLRVRMIDSVGYMVPGAVGAEEDGTPRMVTTPWYDYEIPMTQAAELGTQKVMREHCSIGIVITTDGSITDIPREDYLEAEKKAVEDMEKTGKPFLTVINSRDPDSENARAVKEFLQREYEISPVIADCQSLDTAQIGDMLRQLLYAFPMTQLRVHLPRWLDALEEDHPVKSGLYQALLQCADKIGNIGQAEQQLQSLGELEQVHSCGISDVNLADGSVACTVVLPEQLYYEILSHKAGNTIENDAQLLAYLTALAEIRKEYDRISDALSAVKATGYGVVKPAAEEMQLTPPELLKKGTTFGVKLKAAAPSIHMIRVDVDTEISPMVGDEKQSRDLIAQLTGESAQQLWQSNIFGKSVHDLIQEGLNAKLLGMNEDVRGKFRGTLTKIVNEGASGLICLIL